MLMQPEGPSWRALGKVWPHHEVSRFVEAGGVRWHVQSMGEGPDLLLLHGAGASTHSWRDLMALLAAHFHVVAIDLPGHAFTGSPPVYRPTLPRVARLVGDLIAMLGLKVEMLVGHSAGAAIGARMISDHLVQPAGFVAFNGAFKPFDGMARTVFPALAKLLFVNPFTPRLFAFSGRNPARVERLLEGTGSALDGEGLKYYKILMGSPGHVAGVLAMMAHWDLERLVSDLAHLETPTLLIAGAGDKAVSPQVSRELAACLPKARFEAWDGLGHLAHEEAPDRAAERILTFARSLENAT